MITADGTDLVGASLGEHASVSGIKDVKDLETGWVNASSGGDKPPLKPFCAPQKAGATTGSFYIRVGGDGPSVHSGWGGANKCCQSAIGACRWYGSRALCEAALTTAVCEGCGSCAMANDGCPTWVCEGKSDGLVRLVSSMTSSAALLEATLSNGSTVPVAIKNTVGDGAVVTLLLEDAELLKRYGMQEHLLSRLADDVLPFEIVGANGHDLLPQMEMMLARSSTGWQVSLVNNNGVTKTPGGAAHVDASHDLAVELRLKPAYGTVASAETAAPRSVLKVTGNSVELTVGAGDLAVVLLTLA